MGITDKLHNPTPFDVKIKYDRGIVIQIPADGQVTLSYAQTDDFRPGKPGSEEVKKTLNHLGLFLLDSDRSWDVQALDALKASIQAKSNQLKEFVNRTRNNRASAGTPLTDEALEEILVVSGNGTLRDEIEKLKNRVKLISETVSSDTSARVKNPIDPDRTCFGTQPPREFPTKLALKVFLSENAEIAAKDAQLRDAMAAAESEGVTSG